MRVKPIPSIIRRWRRAVSKVEAMVVIVAVAGALALVLGFAKRIGEIVDGWR